MGGLMGDTSIGGPHERPSFKWIHTGLTCRDVTERATDYLE